MKLFLKPQIDENKMFKLAKENYTFTINKKYINKNQGKGISVGVMIFYILLIVCALISKQLTSVHNIIKIICSIPLIICMVSNITTKRELKHNKNCIKVKLKLYIIDFCGLFCFIFYCTFILICLLSCDVIHGQTYIFPGIYVIIFVINNICYRHSCKYLFIKKYTGNSIGKRPINPIYIYLVTSIVTCLFYRNQVPIILFIYVVYILISILQLIAMNLLYEYHCFEQFYCEK